MSLSRQIVLSLVVVYRDRDMPRARRFLDSLKKQSVHNFELIFVDYGSRLEYQQELQTFLPEYSFVQYVSTATQGHFWNRAKALNLGISFARGQYITTLDIDLILTPDFIETTQAKLLPQSFIRYRCYYLTSSFKSFDKLFLSSFQPQKYFQTTVKTTAFGIITFDKSSWDNVGGYDEKFQLWGLEDIDFVDRIKQQEKCEEVYLSEMRVYHQWHPKTKPTLPKGWFDQMRNYYQTKNAFETKPEALPVPTILSLNERPALGLLANKNTQKTLIFEFIYPKELSMLNFMRQFDQMKSGEAMTVHQKFELISHAKRTVWSRLFNWVNKIYHKVGVSYRWIDLKNYATEIILKEEIRNFICYFLLIYQHQMMDYYFQDDIPDELHLIIVKR